jgi:hypothetical protein
LVELRLDRAWGTSGITDAGLRALPASPQLSKLRCLDLRGQDITDAGAKALMDAPALSRLDFLDLRWTRVGKEMKDILRKHFGRGVCQFSREPRLLEGDGSEGASPRHTPPPVRTFPVRASQPTRPSGPAQPARAQSVWEDDIPF